MNQHNSIAVSHELESQEILILSPITSSEEGFTARARFLVGAVVSARAMLALSVSLNPSSAMPSLPSAMPSLLVLCLAY